ncbi:uncharacterized protein Bfra_007566 [Botrytis fragariae]|uniref:Uncharacterized protein n=1 Tax=Botrytis fragariae TaxID=1964551 RepID=A0A8H6EDR2_9HELO|nr:uncharacterized protein Bfra_007566 [Botrytis fragariae]KAF5868368.1 hypothetical protein Bfra_007566 [Botrytis fragariae]
MASEEKTRIPKPFPQRPQPRHENPHEECLGVKGLPPQSAEMLWALDQGLYFVALSIMRTDAYGIEFGQSVFKGSNSPMENIINVLVFMSKDLLHQAITGKLHESLYNASKDAKLPEFYAVTLYGPEKAQDRPVVYTLVHCNHLGKPPTKNEHVHGSAIAYLMEAAMWNRYPTKRYLLRSLSITNVTDVGSIRFTEHVISILTNSYFSSGGLCGTWGGDKASESRAKNTSNEETWINGMKDLIKQDLHGPDKEALEEEFRIEGYA